MEKKCEGLVGIILGLKVVGYDLKVKDFLFGVVFVVDIVVGVSVFMGLNKNECIEFIIVCG